MKRVNAFLHGLMSVNLFGESYLPEGKNTDMENIAADWQAVGNDIRNAMLQYNNTSADV